MVLYTRYIMAIITTLLDLIFPPRETELLITNATKAGYSLKTSLLVIHQTVCLCDYNEPLVKAAVIENKFHDNKKASLLLAKALEEWCSKQTNQLVLIPVPLSQKRYRDRGYNQVDRIIESMILIPGVRTETKILKKIIDTVPQTSLKKADRLKNTRRAFFAEILNPDLFTNTTLVIIDDVCTTGATLASARAVLQPQVHASTKIICLAIAH